MNILLQVEQAQNITKQNIVKKSNWSNLAISHVLHLK